MARPGVSSTRYPLRRLMDHRRSLAAGDGSSPIVTVVVDDDHVSVDFGASTQVRRGGQDRIQSRREVGLFVEGRDDDRKFIDV